MINATTQPVSAFLLDALRAAQQRHRVQVWLDKDQHYSNFVDALVAQGPDPQWGTTVAWRGSHLEVLRATAPLSGTLEPPHLVLHLPGFNEEDVAASPQYHLYALNESERFRKALPTLVREATAGRVDPERVNAFLAEPGATLEAADVWLAHQLSGVQDALQATLAALTLEQLVDTLITGAGLGAAIAGTEALGATLHRLATHTGLTDAWCEALLDHAPARRDDLAYAVTAWALCVEYVHDLKRPPVDARLQPMVALSRPLRDACHGLAVYLRAHHAAHYRQMALSVETHLADEIAQVQAADLGRIDTFRFEEQRILNAAIDAPAEATEWAATRAEGRSFWTAENPHRRDAWRLVQAVCALDTALAAAPNTRWASMDEALDAYPTWGAPVDHAHRHLEQRRARLLQARVPEFERVVAMLNAARVRWSAWAQEVTARWSQASLGGPLPRDSRQQRQVFEDVVRPMVREGHTVAYVLVDALRYEMAAELHERLADDGQARCGLEAWAAELPSVTAVGMNALMPVARAGRLEPHWRDGEIVGFRAGSYAVCGPRDRERVLRETLNLAKVPWLELEQVAQMPAKVLRAKVGTAKLVIVAGEEIDKSLENGLGPEHFDAALRRLHTTLARLREAGIKRVVVTADHGFLLRRGLNAPRLPFGTKRTPNRRHVWRDQPERLKGVAPTAANALRYGASEGQHLVLAPGLAVFDRGNKTDDCVHGGDSPQERVIPVLTLDFRGQTPTPDTEPVALDVVRQPAVAGLHCLRVRPRLHAEQTSLGFVAPAYVEVEFTALKAPRVNLEVADVRGEGAQQRGDLVRLPLGVSCEVFFTLSGPDHERVQVQASRPANPGTLRHAISADFFAVVGQEIEPSDDASASIERAGQDWYTHIEHPGHRAVLVRLSHQPTMGEQEINTLLGGSRKARRFWRALDGYLTKLPFGARLESINNIKRLVREG